MSSDSSSHHITSHPDLTTIGSQCSARGPGIRRWSNKGRVWSNLKVVKMKVSVIEILDNLHYKSCLSDNLDKLRG